MMGRKIAIIGAGPSGIVAGKELIETGFEPTIFEKCSAHGGVWNGVSGYVWPQMRTNLSKWSCSFSDFPWGAEVEDFPTAAEVDKYISSYSSQFGVANKIEYNHKAKSIYRDGGRWLITFDNNEMQYFDYVVMCSGAFFEPVMPVIDGQARFRGKISHSSKFRIEKHSCGRIAVIGSSFSGIEIAATLAENGLDVILFISEPVWILPRYMSVGTRKAPLDLVLYRRREQEKVSLSTMYQKANAFFDETFGNPGNVHAALRVQNTTSPPLVAISDSFLGHVASGAILPVAGYLTSISENAVSTFDKKYSVDEIIMCTGYRCAVDILGEPERNAIYYDNRDTFISFVADRATLNSRIPNMFFIGMYRGPYFGIIELQARWVAALISNAIKMPSPDIHASYIETEHGIRKLKPRPQFPHGDYVHFADSIAHEIGVAPRTGTEVGLEKVLSEGPVTPAQFRLHGMNAKPKVAVPAVLEAFNRVQSRVQ
jgi:dimethylaniline monooxygenase (N-oxide forming)